MQSRERILLLMVAGLLLLLAGAWGGKRALETLRVRRAEVQRLEAEAGKATLLQATLTELKDRRARLAERSLPPQAETAKAAYGEWLTQLLRDPSVNFSAVNVRRLKDTPEKGFTRLRFQVDGGATYPQVVRFLEKFYAADHLHKITTLHMPLAKDLKLLNVTLTIEALSLRSSQNKEELSQHPSADNPPDELRAAVAQLMLRHFYRANQPPRLGMPNSVPATVGRSVRVPLNGTDPDGDKVSYQLVSGPSWLKVEGGALVSTSNPQEDSYDVVVSVTDDGLPPKSATQQFKISVRPAPTGPPARKEEPFDHMKFAFLEGIIQRGGTPEAMVKVRTLGTYHTLHVGGEEEIGGVKIKVLGIDLVNRTLEIQLPGGARRVVPLGKSLGAEQVPDKVTR